MAPRQANLVKVLQGNGVTITAKPDESEPWYLVLLVQWLPVLVLVGAWFIFMRQMQIGGGKAMSFGKSRAKLLTENQHKITFSDVAAVEEETHEHQESIAARREPK